LAESKKKVENKVRWQSRYANVPINFMFIWFLSMQKKIIAL